MLILNYLLGAKEDKYEKKFMIYIITVIYLSLGDYIHASVSSSVTQILRTHLEAQTRHKAQNSILKHTNVSQA